MEFHHYGEKKITISLLAEEWLSMHSVISLSRDSGQNPGRARIKEGSRSTT